jgi:hypothetical protein
MDASLGGRLERLVHRGLGVTELIEGPQPLPIHTVRKASVGDIRRRAKSRVQAGERTNHERRDHPSARYRAGKTVKLIRYSFSVISPRANRARRISDASCPYAGVPVPFLRPPNPPPRSSKFVSDQSDASNWKAAEPPREVT